MNQQFSDIVSNTELLATALESAYPSVEQQVELILGFRHRHPLSVRNLYIFDSDGSLLLHLTPNIDSEEIRDDISLVFGSLASTFPPELLETVESTQVSSLFVSSTTIIGEVDQIPTLQIGAQIQDEVGVSRSNQILIVDIDLRDFWRSTDEVQFAQTGRTFISSGSGIIIAHPERQYIGQPIPEALRPVLNNFEGNTSFVDPFTNHATLASYSPIGGHTNWGVIVAQDEKEALASTAVIASSAAIILVISFGVATAVTILITTSIVRPIQQLSNIAQEISKTGELDKQIDVHGTREVHRLGFALEQMLQEVALSKKNLQERITQLQLLRSIDHSLSSSGTLIEVIHTVKKPLREMLQCDELLITHSDMISGNVVTVDPHHETLQTVLYLPQNRALLEKIAHEAEPIVSTVQANETVTPLEQYFAERNMNLMLFASLLVDDEYSLLIVGWRDLQKMTPRYEEIIKDVVRQLRLLGEQFRAEHERSIYAQRLERDVATRTEQLEVANKNLETFSYSVSHDLRAPLRAMTGFARILNQQYAQLLPDKPKHYLERIQTNANRMGELIDSLLRLSRLGRQAVKWQSVQLQPLVEYIVGQNKDLSEYQHIEVTIKTLPTISADESLIQIVYNNLINNAFKYSAKVDAPQIEIGQTIEESDQSMTFYVKDNGVGFDMKYAHKLFGVFERLHDGKEYAGTGVGLATAQRIIQMHNGKIWAFSELNVGTTFYFTLGHKEDDI